MIKLRPYQEKGIHDIRSAMRDGHRRIVYVLPTGGGKTLCFSYISAGVFQNGKRVLILAHRAELLEQISSALHKVDVPHAVLDASFRGIPRQSRVVVASVFTLARRLEHFPTPDVIVADECHHFAGNNTFAKCINHFSQAKILGVTATPIRLDGTGLDTTFDHMVVGPAISELMRDGYLCVADVYAPRIAPNLKGVRKRAGDYAIDGLADAMRKPSITGDAVSHYARLLNGMPSIAFCCSIEHAMETRESFRGAGFSSEVIHGSLDKDTRKKMVAAFSEGRINVLASVDLINEGFDVPGMYGAILLRPTMSLSLHMQQIGRALRPFPGKERAIILDHAGNCMMHGLPDEDRKWSLAGIDGEKKGKSDAISLATCRKCLAMFRPHIMVCPKCGAEREIKGRKPEVSDGDLERVTEIPKEILVSVNERMSRERTVLEHIARQKGYKHGWVHFMLQAKRKKIMETAVRNYAMVSGDV